MNKPKLNKYLTFSISKEKSLLDILDSVEESKDIDIKDSKKICKCCGKFVVKFLEEHQIKCFENKIEDLTTKLKLQRENIMHEIHIKGLELLIERNNQKWNKIYKINGNQRV